MDPSYFEHVNMTDSVLKNLIVSMRPKQWPKNFFVLAALVFAKEFFNPSSVGWALLALAIFCLASSSVYMINDVCDLEADREHPSKKHRPLAAGRISRTALLSSGLISLALALGASFLLSTFFTLTLASYVLLNFLYSLWLKRLIFIDVMSVAAGFVLRVVAGALAINVPFSVWLILCTFFLTLFLAIGKRKSELLLAASAGRSAGYTLALLDQMNMVVLPSIIIAYSFYTFSSPHSQWLMITIPIVLYGLFRYLFLINTKTAADDGPSDDLLMDRPLQLTLLVWAVAAVLILLYAR